MTGPDELQCRIIAERDPGSRLWRFYLVNDGAATIESAELVAVRYEWGDQYLGEESPGVCLADLKTGGRALLWRDDGSSELRTDLWLRVLQQGCETWLLFEFPRLHRQTGTTLVAQAEKMERPPDGMP